MKIDKTCEKWLEEQRIITQNLKDDAVGDIKYHAKGRLEFIELIQQFIKDGVIEIKDDLSDSIFINHIQQHLKPNEVVVCKICGKTAKEIIKEHES